jgi:hypothetical protein
VEEAQGLIERRFFFREKLFSVLIKSFICDAPARDDTALKVILLNNMVASDSQGLVGWLVT